MSTTGGDPFAVADSAAADIEMVGTGTSSHRRIAVRTGDPATLADRVRQRCDGSARELGWGVSGAGDTLVVHDVDGRRLGSVRIGRSPAGITVSVRSRSAEGGRWLPTIGAALGLLAPAALVGMGILQPWTGVGLAAVLMPAAGLLGLVIAGLIVSAPGSSGARAFAAWSRRLPELVERAG